MDDIADRTRGLGVAAYSTVGFGVSLLGFNGSTFTEFNRTAFQLAMFKAIPGEAGARAAKLGGQPSAGCHTRSQAWPPHRRTPLAAGAGPRVIKADRFSPTNTNFTYPRHSRVSVRATATYTGAAGEADAQALLDLLTQPGKLQAAFAAAGLAAWQPNLEYTTLPYLVRLGMRGIIRQCRRRPPPLPIDGRTDIRPPGRRCR